MNASPYFYNAAGINPVTNKLYLPRPFLNRNAFGGTIGGPIIKDKLFFFGSYQGVRIADEEASTKLTTVPLALTDDRSTQGIVNMVNSDVPPPQHHHYREPDQQRCLATTECQTS